MLSAIQNTMTTHKDKKILHHLSREVSSADGWVESLTSLSEDVQATQLLDEVANIKEVRQISNGAVL